VGRATGVCRRIRPLIRWRGSYGSWWGQDSNRAGDYPICALTFDLVWHHYSNANLYGKTVAAEDIANTVRDLFTYITGQGQAELAGHYYARFPSGLQGHVNQAVNPGIGY